MASHQNRKKCTESGSVAFRITRNALIGTFERSRSLQCLLCPEYKKQRRFSGCSYAVSLGTYDLFASRDCLCLPLCGDIFVPNSSILISKVSRIADSEQSVMLMLGRCLPHIVPNVLLAKREVTHDLLTQQSHLIFHQPLHLPCPLRLASSSHSILNSTLTQLNFFHCSCVCLSLSLSIPQTQSTSLSCVHSFLLLLLCMHLTAPIENGCEPLSGEWEHIGTFLTSALLPSFMRVAFDFSVGLAFHQLPYLSVTQNAFPFYVSFLLIDFCFALNF